MMSPRRFIVEKPHREMSLPEFAAAMRSVHEADMRGPVKMQSRVTLAVRSPRPPRARLRSARYVSAAEHARRPVTFASSGPVTMTWSV
jgi:hypothetical protein